MYFKHNILFFFKKRNMAKNTFIYGQKSKTKGFIEKSFTFLEERKNTVKLVLFDEGFPLYPGYGPGFISANFDIFDQ